MMSVDACRKVVQKLDFSPVRFIPERIEENFERLDHALFHTLRIASSNDPMRHVGKSRQTLFIPCAWGVRRDDYQWDGDCRDMAVFRGAATAMAALLLSRPMPAWRNLLPGPIEEVMETDSELYLADYWVLTLHHLVWTKQLPYSIDAQWMQGCSIRDEGFYFVSELPIDLAKASQDALILFQEAATAALVAGRNLFDEPEESSSLCVTEPPLYCDGRWRLAEGEAESGDHHEAASADEDDGTFAETDRPREAPEESDVVQSLDLDDQSFTVRFGNRSCRFEGRNKQLFALLERISRRPGHRVAFDDLRSVGDVWNGSPVEDSTVRGAVTRLRRRLKNDGLSEFADRIITGTYQQVSYVTLRQRT